MDCQLHKENKEARDRRTQKVNKPELERDNEKEYPHGTNVEARTKSLNCKIHETVENTTEGRLSLRSKRNWNKTNEQNYLFAWSGTDVGSRRVYGVGFSICTQTQ